MVHFVILSVGEGRLLLVLGCAYRFHKEGKKKNETYGGARSLRLGVGHSVKLAIDISPTSALK